MTAIAGGRESHLRVMTSKKARREIERLLKTVKMTRDELEARGDAWELDADQRGVLSDIRGLEFLLERAAADK